MDKVRAFLEKYIEWIAITIGGLVFMYALWTFWIAPDVTAEVGAQTVGPRNVDTTVLRGPGASLESAMASPIVRVPPYVQDLPGEFQRELQIGSYEPARLFVPGIWVGPNPMGRPDETIPEDFRVTQAPVPPAAFITRLASGRSFADVPGAAEQVSARDLAEVRVDFVIPPFGIAQAFREVRLPAVHQNTSMLRVTLMRQRLLADGSWGEDTQVALLENNPLATMPLPAPEAAVAAKADYVTFVEENPGWVIEPPFFDVRAGDDPTALEMVIEVPVPGEDPAATKPATNQATRTNPNHQGDPRAPERPGNAERPPDPAPQAQPGQRQPQATGQQQPPPLIGGRGAFNAAQHQGAMRGWAWDTQAIPGETYRYRVVYAIKNPMFNTRGVAAANKPELEALLALVSSSEGAEWSPPITVEPLTYFYMTGGSAAQAKFTVFRWQNGGWQSQDFDVTPGDAIGSDKTGGIDYRTGRTLVDLRQDPANNETYALLVDGEGRFMRSSVKDASDPKYKQLQEEVKANDGVASR